MAEVLLSTDEITVIGGPEKVSLTVDIGPEGTRGSYIFAGNGNPNDSGTIIGQSPNINDLFINLENTSEDFSYLYQYKAEPGGAVWQHILKLTPSMYAKNIVTSFVNGVSTIPVPIFDIITSTTDISNISELNFSVQCQVIGVKPAEGNFGPVTDKAVKAFQKANGIKVTGIVDSQTYKSILGSK